MSLYKELIQGFIRADSRFAPRQCETALLCNDVPHWLGASLESTLFYSIYILILRCTEYKSDMVLTNLCFCINVSQYISRVVQQRIDEDIMQFCCFYLSMELNSIMWHVSIVGASSLKYKYMNISRVSFRSKCISIGGLVEDCTNSIAIALELLQSCTKPSTWITHVLPVSPHMSQAGILNHLNKTHATKFKFLSISYINSQEPKTEMKC